LIQPGISIDYSGAKLRRRPGRIEQNENRKADLLDSHRGGNFYGGKAGIGLPDFLSVKIITEILKKSLILL